MQAFDNGSMYKTILAVHRAISQSNLLQGIRFLACVCEVSGSNISRGSNCGPLWFSSVPSRN